MTRKDYIKVASILNNIEKADIDPISFEELVGEFSDMFFTDNPNFQPNKFEMACYKNK